MNGLQLAQPSEMPCAAKAHPAADARQRAAGAPLFAWPDRISAWVDKRDLAAAGLLAAIIFALRAPFLNVLLHGRDEAEYQATAAYLVANHLSAFSLPNMGYTFGAYQLAAGVAGPYQMWPIRLATSLIVLAIALIIYRWSAEATSRPIGLAAAAYFSVFNMWLEGFASNREWPAVLPLVAGGYLFFRSRAAAQRWDPRLVFAAGFVTALGLFFKEQVAYITLAIPLWLLLAAVGDRRLQPWLKIALLYALGGVTAGLVYIVPYALYGSLVEHLRAELQFGSSYAFTAPPADWLPASTNPVNLYFLFLPMQLFLAIAYLGAGWEIVAYLRKLVSGPVATTRQPAASLGLLPVCYALTAAAAVAMGGRFFENYYLLWIPFMGLLFAQGLARLAYYPASRVAGVCLTVVLLLGLKELAALGTSPRAWLILALVIAAGAVFVWRKRQAWPIVRVLQVTLAGLLLAIYIESFEGSLRLAASNVHVASTTSPSVSTRAYFAEQNYQPGDRLFVWGWLPELYCVTQLEPANRVVVCNGLAQQFFASGEVRGETSEALLAVLRSRPPRYLVAAASDRVPVGHVGLYGLESFPGLATYVREHYQRAARLSECDVYELR